MTPIGNSERKSIDVRVIAATNMNLEEAIKKHKFRADLFYRLNTVPISIPPLRDRIEDISLIANFFIKDYNAEENGKILGLKDCAIDRLMQYHWPGNVRELDNVIQRAIILHNDHLIDAGDLLIENFDSEIITDMPTDNSGEDKLGNELKLQEHQIILDTLNACQGSRKDVAERLGISPRTLRYKIAKMRDSGIQIPA